MAGLFIGSTSVPNGNSALTSPIYCGNTPVKYIYTKSKMVWPLYQDILFVIDSNSVPEYFAAGRTSTTVGAQYDTTSVTFRAYAFRKNVYSPYNTASNNYLSFLHYLNTEGTFGQNPNNEATLTKSALQNVNNSAGKLYATYYTFTVSNMPVVYGVEKNYVVYVNLKDLHNNLITQGTVTIHKSKYYGETRIELSGVEMCMYPKGDDAQTHYLIFGFKASNSNYSSIISAMASNSCGISVTYANMPLYKAMVTYLGEPTSTSWTKPTSAPNGSGMIGSCEVCFTIKWESKTSTWTGNGVSNTFVYVNGSTNKFVYYSSGDPSAAAHGSTATPCRNGNYLQVSITQNAALGSLRWNLNTTTSSYLYINTGGSSTTNWVILPKQDSSNKLSIRMQKGNNYSYP